MNHSIDEEEYYAQVQSTLGYHSNDPSTLSRLQNQYSDMVSSVHQNYNTSGNDIQEELRYFATSENQSSDREDHHEYLEQESRSHANYGSVENRQDQRERVLPNGSTVPLNYGVPINHHQAYHPQLNHNQMQSMSNAHYTSLYQPTATASVPHMAVQISNLSNAYASAMQSQETRAALRNDPLPPAPLQPVVHEGEPPKARSIEEEYAIIIQRTASAAAKSSNTKYRCLFCNFTFVGGPQKIRVHLTGKRENGTRLSRCENCPEDVRKKLEERMKAPKELVDDSGLFEDGEANTPSLPPRNAEEHHCIVLSRSGSTNSKSSNTRYKCIYCRFKYVGGPQKIRVHLTGQTEGGTRMAKCTRVPPDVVEQMEHRRKAPRLDIASTTVGLQPLEQHHTQLALPSSSSSSSAGAVGIQGQGVQAQIAEHQPLNGSSQSVHSQSSHNQAPHLNMHQHQQLQQQQQHSQQSLQKQQQAAQAHQLHLQQQHHLQNVQRQQQLLLHQQQMQQQQQQQHLHQHLQHLQHQHQLNQQHLHQQQQNQHSQNLHPSSGIGGVSRPDGMSGMLPSHVQHAPLGHQHQQGLPMHLLHPQQQQQQHLMHLSSGMPNPALAMHPHQHQQHQQSQLMHRQLMQPHAVHDLSVSLNQQHPFYHNAQPSVPIPQGNNMHQHIMSQHAFISSLPTSMQGYGSNALAHVNSHANPSANGHSSVEQGRIQQSQEPVESQAAAEQRQNSLNDSSFVVTQKSLEEHLEDRQERSGSPKKDINQEQPFDAANDADGRQVQPVEHLQEREGSPNTELLKAANSDERLEKSMEGRQERQGSSDDESFEAAKSPGGGINLGEAPLQEEPSSLERIGKNLLAQDGEAANGNRVHRDIQTQAQQSIAQSPHHEEDSTFLEAEVGHKRARE
jgi:hypothetical protein